MSATWDRGWRRHGRLANDVRHLDLVAGGNAVRIGALPRTDLDTIEIELPEPRPSLAIGATLAAIGGLRALRKRLFA